MILEPEIFHHPKYINLKAKFTKAGIEALETLAKLWAHCQQNKRGQYWPGANADYVEVICCGKSKNGNVFQILVDCGWVTEREGGIEIHDWDKHNASLVARWKRRPAHMSTHTSTQVSAQRSTQQPTQVSAHVAAQTHDRTGQDQTGSDRIRQDRRGEEEAAHTEVEIPSLAEVRTWAEMSGVDPDYAETKWHTSNENHSFILHGRVVDWRKKWLRFWAEDRATWRPKLKNSAASNSEDSVDSWSIETLERAYHGALMGENRELAEKFKAILETRRRAA